MKQDGQLDEQRGPEGRGAAAAAGHGTLTWREEINLVIHVIDRRELLTTL